MSHVALKILCVILVGAATTRLPKLQDKKVFVDQRTESEKFKDRLEILKKRCKGWL